ncbi:hypothetical protein GOP47_0003556 [Adiantum capillus-veneris]|uniref:Uncharacterized protein n=1 Tax=Adiantum capillus-veneris TaxID=13818 RepID=A0A9D4ZQ97_ADICA|nr:hypothetical protein GOP47_0030549 [Adiantum capillus-veneris]KAI5083813.1 hypothetical protein GOP47_0003556 [Adiantum capillus-veneris]
MSSVKTSAHREPCLVILLCSFFNASSHNAIARPCRLPCSCPSLLLVTMPLPCATVHVCALFARPGIDRSGGKWESKEDYYCPYKGARRGGRGASAQPTMAIGAGNFERSQIHSESGAELIG